MKAWWDKLRGADAQPGDEQTQRPGTVVVDGDGDGDGDEAGQHVTAQSQLRTAPHTVNSEQTTRPLAMIDRIAVSFDEWTLRVGQAFKQKLSSLGDAVQAYATEVDLYNLPKAEQLILDQQTLLHWKQRVVTRGKHEVTDEDFMTPREQRAYILAIREIPGPQGYQQLLEAVTAAAARFDELSARYTSAHASSDALPVSVEVQGMDAETAMQERSQYMQFDKRLEELRSSFELEGLTGLRLDAHQLIEMVLLFQYKLKRDHKGQLLYQSGMSDAECEYFARFLLVIPHEHVLSAEQGDISPELVHTTLVDALREIHQFALLPEKFLSDNRCVEILNETSIQLLDDVLLSERERYEREKALGQYGFGQRSLEEEVRHRVRMKKLRWILLTRAGYEIELSSDKVIEAKVKQDLRQEIRTFQAKQAAQCAQQVAEAQTDDAPAPDSPRVPRRAHLSVIIQAPARPLHPEYQRTQAQHQMLHPHVQTLLGFLSEAAARYQKNQFRGTVFAEIPPHQFISVLEPRGLPDDWRQDHIYLRKREAPHLRRFYEALRMLRHSVGSLYPLAYLFLDTLSHRVKRDTQFIKSLAMLQYLVQTPGVLTVNELQALYVCSVTQERGLVKAEFASLAEDIKTQVNFLLDPYQAVALSDANAAVVTDEDGDVGLEESEELADDIHEPYEQRVAPVFTLPTDMSRDKKQSHWVAQKRLSPKVSALYQRSVFPKTRAAYLTSRDVRDHEIEETPLLETQRRLRLALQHLWAAPSKIQSLLKSHMQFDGSVFERHKNPAALADAIASVLDVNCVLDERNFKRPKAIRQLPWDVRQELKARAAMVRGQLYALEYAALDPELFNITARDEFSLVVDARASFLTVVGALNELQFCFPELGSMPIKSPGMPNASTKAARLGAMTQFLFSVRKELLNETQYQGREEAKEALDSIRNLIDRIYEEFYSHFKEGIDDRRYRKATRTLFKVLAYALRTRLKNYFDTHDAPELPKERTAFKKNAAGFYNTLHAYYRKSQTSIDEVRRNIQRIEHDRDTQEDELNALSSKAGRIATLKNSQAKLKNLQANLDCLLMQAAGLEVGGRKYRRERMEMRARISTNVTGRAAGTLKAGASKTKRVRQFKQVQQRYLRRVIEGRESLEGYYQHLRHVPGGLVNSTDAKALFLELRQWLLEVPDLVELALWRIEANKFIRWGAKSLSAVVFQQMALAKESDVIVDEFWSIEASLSDSQNASESDFATERSDDEGNGSIHHRYRYDISSDDEHAAPLDALSGDDSDADSDAPRPGGLG